MIFQQQNLKKISKAARFSRNLWSRRSGKTGFSATSRGGGRGQWHAWGAPEAAGGNDLHYIVTFTFAALHFARIVARRCQDLKYVAAIIAFVFIYRHYCISNAFFCRCPSDSQVLLTDDIRVEPAKLYVGNREKKSLFKQICENFTWFAYFQFVFLGDIQGAFTECTGQKPAEMPALKLPGGALLFYRTGFLFPAWCKAVFPAPLIDQQKVDVSFNMCWDCSPALLIAMNSF